MCTEDEELYPTGGHLATNAAGFLAPFPYGRRIVDPSLVTSPRYMAGAWFEFSDIWDGVRSGADWVASAANTAVDAVKKIPGIGFVVDQVTDFSNTSFGKAFFAATSPFILSEMFTAVPGVGMHIAEVVSNPVVMNALPGLVQGEPVDIAFIQSFKRIAQKLGPAATAAAPGALAAISEQLKGWGYDPQQLATLIKQTGADAEKLRRDIAGRFDVPQMARSLGISPEIVKNAIDGALRTAITDAAQFLPNGDFLPNAPELLRSQNAAVSRTADAALLARGGGNVVPMPSNTPAATIYPTQLRAQILKWKAPGGMGVYGPPPPAEARPEQIAWFINAFRSTTAPELVALTVDDIYRIFGEYTPAEKITHNAQPKTAEDFQGLANALLSTAANIPVNAQFPQLAKQASDMRAQAAAYLAQAEGLRRLTPEQVAANAAANAPKTADQYRGLAGNLFAQAASAPPEQIGNLIAQANAALSQANAMDQAAKDTPMGSAPVPYNKANERAKFFAFYFGLSQGHTSAGFFPPFPYRRLLVDPSLITSPRYSAGDEMAEFYPECQP